MLKELYIENLAIIEKATIPFSEKLNVFSGETGAGKSILIGGINAIMGGRVSKDIVRAGMEKATVTALFTDLPANVKSKLEENGYETEDELIIQREITSDGKSTARICGKVTTAAVLREIADEMVNIHGQHDNRLLTNTEKQRELLDSYGGILPELEDYGAKFRRFSALSKKIKTLAEESTLKDSRVELLKERIKDLSAYKFKDGEEEEVERELSAVRNAEAIRQGLATVYSCLNGNDDGTGALYALRISRQETTILSKYIPDCAELKKRLDGLYIEADDIKSEIYSLVSDNPDSAARLTYLEERMSDILRAKRKYGLEFNELNEKLDEWKKELEELDSGDDTLEKLVLKRKELGEELKTQAQKITEIRRTTAEKLVEKIGAELVYLDMPNVRLLFDIQKDKITVNGMDKIEMLISVNKGEEPKPMAKIASGGELSRIMLAIKNVLATNDDIPTMIFDEIDTGISGRAAQKVGKKLSEIALKRQVLCVTHLAQIAAMADNHLLIEKKNDSDRTYTNVYQLDFEGRKHEISRIISGDENNVTSLQTAEELLTRKER